jgi:putative addiction module killer protein
MTKEGRQYALDYYIDEEGREPFTEWLDSLRDRTAEARIRIRLNRVVLGNFGTVESVGQGVSELKIDYGPGYRLYYAMTGKTVVLLLIGGDKSTQRKDISTAKAYWQNYQER